MCVCVYIYIYIHTYIYTHTRTQTHRPIYENSQLIIDYKIKFVVCTRTHVVTYIKLRRAGHISRVGTSKTPQKISEGTTYGSAAVRKRDRRDDQEMPERKSQKEQYMAVQQ